MACFQSQRYPGPPVLLGELQLGIGRVRLGFYVEVQLHRASPQTAIGIRQDAAVEPAIHAGPAPGSGVKN